MKIGIIAANNIRLSPYIFFYTRIFDNMNLEYEIIYPQRSGFVDDVGCKAHMLQWDINKKSLWNYFDYRKQVIQIVRKEKYDMLVILTSINASFLSNWIKKEYKGRYIVDIRDYTYEDNPVYYYCEKKALDNSLLNVISSARFRLFLPNGKYQVCHNVSMQNEKNIMHWEKKGKDTNIIIGYVGALAYEKQCKSMMDLVKNDNRFSFHFYGSSNLEPILKSYADRLSCDRIKFFGSYKASEKRKIIDQVDILFNAYGNDRPLLTCALSNKLYDALYYKKMLITSPGTYMEELGGYLAYSIDFNQEKSLDSLYEWYMTRDEKLVEDYANTMFAQVVKENDETIQKIMVKVMEV